MPLDLYMVSQQLYREGEAKKIKNSYIADIVEIYLPWKYYLAQYPERIGCEAQIKGKVATSISPGVKLPQGECYPLQAVHHYIFTDLYFPLRILFSLFAAYDLSYLGLLLAIYISFFYFFKQISVFIFSGRKTELHFIAIGAALATFSFPVARDLQYDGLSQSLPFLLISLGIFCRYRQEENFFSLCASILFLFFAITRSSLQALGFCLLFWVTFNLVWHFNFIKERSSRVVYAGMGVTCALLSGLYFHRLGILVFLNQSQSFLPQNGVPVLVQVIKRFCGLLFSWAEFLLGPNLFSFDTVDFSKILNPMGAREYFSYDGNSFFIHPMVSILFLGFVVGALTKRDFRWRGWKILIWIVVVDAAIILLPTYKIFYFRFHQWWMLTNLSLLVLMMFENLDHFRIPWKSIVFGVVGLVFLGIMAHLQSEKLLFAMAGKGKLGFEAGFWEHRLNTWIARLMLQDFISWAFWLSGITGLFLVQKKQNYLVLILIVFSGLYLNTFHYNSIQSIDPYDTFVNYMKDHSVGDWKEKPGIELAPNVNLLVDKPVSSLYESLGTRLESQ